MGRYFFDIRDATGMHRDTIGEECENFDEARQQAQSLLPDVIRTQLPDGEYHLVTCDVRDEDDRTVYRGEISYRGTRFPVFGLARTNVPPDNIDLA